MLYQPDEILTRGGFPRRLEADSLVLVGGPGHAERAGDQNGHRGRGASAPCAARGRWASGGAAVGDRQRLVRHEPAGGGRGCGHGPADAQGLGSSFQRRRYRRARRSAAIRAAHAARRGRTGGAEGDDPARPRSRNRRRLGLASGRRLPPLQRAVRSGLHGSRHAAADEGARPVGSSAVTATPTSNSGSKTKPASGKRGETPTSGTSEVNARSLRPTSGSSRSTSTAPSAPAPTTPSVWSCPTPTRR